MRINLKASLASGLLAASVILQAACATTGKPAEQQTQMEPPPEIYANMPLEQAVSAAVNYGGDTLDSVKRLIKKRNEAAQTAKIVAKSLTDQVSDMQPHQLLNAAHLYAAHADRLPPDLFTQLVRSARIPVRMLGWQLAAAKPSAEIARSMDAELTRAIAAGEEEQVLVPQMANAVRANRLGSSYTVVRQGLMTVGSEEFALAMTALDPRRASDDFLQYLAMVPPEELRQLTLSTVNLYTCVAILKHMRRYPPAVGATNFENLYFYSVSRNTGLAELAQAVLESYLPEQSEMLAQMLAKHPAWVQMAYLESSRRRMNPKIGLLLGDLKQFTPEKDVANEIKEITQ
jgi:hypothetical protein